MKKLQIIKEFQNLISPLSEGEHNLLEQSILKEGIRDPIVVYGDTIVDGHNRYEIAQEHNLEFDIIDKKFGSMNEAKVWIVENQLGRRNIIDFVKYELVEMMARSDLLIIGKQKQGARTDLLSPVDKTPHNTQKIMADKLGWSTGKVGMAKLVKQNADLETLQELREDKLSINTVYKKIKSKIKEDLPIVGKTKPIQNVNSKTASTEKLFKYELMASSELNNATIDHMKNNKDFDKEEAAIDLWSKGVNYEYYIKEEI